ncbi:hypothetical protein GQ85_23770 [Rhodococcus rhodochrous]|nr:hypothetical protein GQ85_23770 [Rhodococcus rhodochrous]
MRPTTAPLRGALVEELGLLARWLHDDGVRIVRTTQGWSEPLHGAGAWAQWGELARTARAGAEPVTIAHPLR